MINYPNDLIYVPADKSDNYYKVTKEKHEDMRKKVVTKDYKKGKHDAVEKVKNKTDKKLAEN